MDFQKVQFNFSI